MLVGTFELLHLSKCVDVSIPDRDSCWLELSLSNGTAKLQKVSIPDRDSCWLELIATSKSPVAYWSVSIPDRDSCWLEPN